MTPPEARLWLRLRDRTQGGPAFRRQHPCGPHVLDFYCAAARLAVEVDGFVHEVADQPDRDAIRDAWLLRQGIFVYRIPAKAVFDDVDEVAEAILGLARQRIRHS